MIRPRTTARKGAADDGAPSSANNNPRSTKAGASKRSRRPGASGGIPFSLLIILLFGILLIMGASSIYTMLYITHTSQKPAPNRNLRRISTAKLEKLLNNIRQDFYARYGGPEMAIEMLNKGVTALGSIDATAHRMLQAANEQRPFVMAFSGYSVTVGRGNFFNQSFPFVVQRILDGPMQQVLGTPVVVRNGAIGGIPSFPYGFCLEHFLGSDPDVISWDYSMNEGGRDASVLEAFVRQAMQQLPKRPMMIMLDTNSLRTKLLRDYTDKGLLADAIAVGKKEVLKDSIFHMDPLPEGVQQWDEFGAPGNCPGRGSWHPKKKEHELIGWMIAMHFLQALERAHELQQERAVPSIGNAPAFPAPLTNPASNDPEITELLYGHKGDHDQYVMKDLSCRTSFLPATDSQKVIPSIVVDGFAEGNLDIMIDRTDAHYKEGWVLDVSKVERDTKRKVEKCGGLGYVDMKIAMYGIPESGVLRLWLPYEAHHGKQSSGSSANDGSDASKWFDDLVICEANEKRPDHACKLDQDIDVTVGGVKAAGISPINGAAAYLKRRTCVNVGVPSGAKVTTLGNVRSTDGRPLSRDDKKKFGVDDSTVGLVVDIQARPNVKREDGACCLSHIVWEQH